LEDFTFVEINGMKITDPIQAYAILWEALTQQRVTPKHANDLLEKRFSSAWPDNEPSW
jgi:origin recognition complex subunit 1